MSWIQENKVAATIIGITVVVSGVLSFLGMSANTDAEKARKKEQAAVNKINTLQAAKPYPSKENEQMLADNLANFAAETKKFQDTMLTYLPEKLPELTTNEFNVEFSKYINRLTDYYTSKEIELPNKGKCYFGMEIYESKMPKDSTLYLNYNLQALDWLFTNLADSGIVKLNNIYRAPVAETLGKDTQPVKPDTSSKKKTSKSKPQSLSSVYDGLPIEITFTGTEASLQQFISKVVASDLYFFTIIHIKIRNEEQDPVTISKAAFAPTATPPQTTPDPTTTPAPFEGAEFDTEPGLGFGNEFFGKPADKKIIKQVIGDEKITVFIQLELVHFKKASSVPIPRIIEQKPDKDTPKKVSAK